jgi:hypothetical protein
MYDWYDEPLFLPPPRPRDAKIDEAKAALMADLFEARAAEVFYGRQIEVFFERRFYHWITVSALTELVAEGQILSEKMQLREGLDVRFYWAKRNRYWRRQAGRILGLIARYSADEVGRAVGAHGELMFDAALPQAGFMPRARNLNAYNGITWAKTGHDLDRVFERDGISYGTEIKNTLDYIERDELEIKLEMCETLQLKPLFILRFAPTNYIELVRLSGGFTLIFEWQLYPFGYEALGKELRDTLGLKVDSPRTLAAGTVQRFLTWHLKQLPSAAEAPGEGS